MAGRGGVSAQDRAGAADKSYGIHVARLAGVPKEVIGRSKEILAELEEEHLDAEGRGRIARPRPSGRPARLQLTLFGAAEHPLLDEVRQVDLDATTPLAALQLVEKWQERLKAEVSRRREPPDVKDSR